MTETTTTKTPSPVDIFALARQQLAERRKAEEEREHRWTAAAMRAESAEDGRQDNALGPTESTLLFCGAPNTGKSWLLSRFLDGNGRRDRGNGQAERTVALEYSFASRPRGTGRQLVHCWELAGGASMANLLGVPLNLRNLHTTTVLLFLDLGKSEQFQALFESLVGMCRNRVEQLREGEKQLPDGRQPKVASADRRVLRPIGLSLVLVCARYDEFQNMDSERKRQTYSFIRFFAHINGASIITLSMRMDSLVQKTLALLASLAFGSAPPRAFNVDHQQPLFVAPHGADSLEKIDPSPDSPLRALGSFSEAMFHLLHALNEVFPQRKAQDGDHAVVGDVDELVGDRQFAEAAIDSLVEERMRKLELFAREKRDRQETEQRELAKRKEE